MPETGAAEKSARTVGSYLREVRESKGIALEEAASVTRIGRNYLAAIEGDIFDKLPSSAYVKGFLRVYAGYLGLPGDEIVAMYDKTWNSQQVQQPREVEKEDFRKGKTAASVPGRWLVPLILLGAVIVSAYFLGDKGGKTDKALREPPSVATVAQVATRPAPIHPPRSSAGQNPGPAVAPDTGKSLTVAMDTGKHGGIILRLKVNQDCWLNITIDDAVSQQYDLKAGDLIEWKGEKLFALDIGNAGGIEGEFNGVPLKPFGEPGKTAHIILKAQDT